MSKPVIDPTEHAFALPLLGSNETHKWLRVPLDEQYLLELKHWIEAVQEMTRSMTDRGLAATAPGSTTIDDKRAVPCPELAVSGSEEDDAYTGRTPLSRALLFFSHYCDGVNEGRLSTQKGTEVFVANSLLDKTDFYSEGQLIPSPYRLDTGVGTSGVSWVVQSLDTWDGPVELETDLVSLETVLRMLVLTTTPEHGEQYREELVRLSQETPDELDILFSEKRRILNEDGIQLVAPPAPTQYEHAILLSSKTASVRDRAWKRTPEIRKGRTR